MRPTHKQSIRPDFTASHDKAQTEHEQPAVSRPVTCHRVAGTLVPTNVRGPAPVSHRPT